MHPQNFMILGRYKLNNAENETTLSLCHYINSYSPEGAINMSTFWENLWAKAGPNRASIDWSENRIMLDY